MARWVQLPADSTGKSVETTSATTVATFLHHEIHLPYARPDRTFTKSTVLQGIKIVSIVDAETGSRNYITSLSASNSSGTGVLITFRDGSTGGTIRKRMYMASSGGGFTQSFLVPIRNATNSSFAAAINAVVDNAYVSVEGYRNSE